LEHTALDPGLTLVVGADAGDIGRTEVVTVAIEVRPSIENGVILQADKAALGISLIFGGGGKNAGDSSGSQYIVTKHNRYLMLKN
jgi:hypothetical protein